MATCLFPGCGWQARRRGLCYGHHTQRVRGKPLQPLKLRQPQSASLAERLLARIEYETNGWGCWLWAGAYGARDQPQMWFEGRPQLAHRLAYRVWRGDLPPERPHACHHCDTPPCIRPDHLWAGTHAENMADMVRKGRGRGRLSR